MSDYTTNSNNTGLWVLAFGAAVVVLIAGLYVASGPTTSDPGAAPAAADATAPAIAPAAGSDAAPAVQ